jgi:hypothetical protein
MLVGYCQDGTWTGGVLKSGFWPLAFISWLKSFSGQHFAEQLGCPASGANQRCRFIDQLKRFEARFLKSSGKADLRAEPTHQEQSEPVGNRSIQAVWSEAT